MKETLISALPAIIVGIFLYFFNRKADKRYEENRVRAEVRKKEGHLSLEMQMATAKLAYATAIALKRGYANGEVEDATDAYDIARENYLKFINGEFINHIQE